MRFGILLLLFILFSPALGAISIDSVLVDSNVDINNEVVWVNLSISSSSSLDQTLINLSMNDFLISYNVSDSCTGSGTINCNNFFEQLIPCGDYQVSVFSNNTSGESAVDNASSFELDSLSLSYSVINDSIISASSSLTGSVSYCSGSNSFDSLVVDLTGINSTSVNNIGFFELFFDNSNSAGISDYSLTASDGVYFDYDSFSVNSVASVFNASPLRKSFDFDEVDYHAFSFEVQNPSSEIQSYRINLYPGGSGLRLPDRRGSMVFDVNPESSYFSHLQLNPGGEGEFLAVVEFENLDSEIDSKNFTLTINVQDFAGFEEEIPPAITPGLDLAGLIIILVCSLIIYLRI